MEKQTLDEILAALTGERTLFHYVRDGYALTLLKDYIGDGMNISDLRQSPYAHLLTKPIVKQVMARAGKGKLIPDLLDWAMWDHSRNAGDNAPLNFVLTLGQWGNDDKSERTWNQTSRSGYNLVLQLNFANDHNQRYKQLIKADDYAAFSYHGHPVITDGRYETLAWARIDLDFDNNVALIEEIQSDWVRQAKEEWNQSYYEEADFDTYLGEVLAPYAKVWDEAVLTAAINLIRHDLGIDTVLYNTYETGNLMKGLESDCLPPRSLYTKLPKKFGFKQTKALPAFLRNERHIKGIQKKRKHKQPVALHWFELP